ncbi:MAG TPA: hypothetical protein VNC50_21895 [Planctomycetia bacterium]|nr:hypothetical protein [Planctomycetia bacterium]
MMPVSGKTPILIPGEDGAGRSAKYDPNVKKMQNVAPGAVELPPPGSIDGSLLFTGMPATLLPAPEMLGDFLGTPATAGRMRTIARYKIADNNSPLPQSRVLYDGNYFREAFGAGHVYRQLGGMEFAFLERMASIDTRIGANSFIGFDDHDWTDVTDLRTTFKAMLLDAPGLHVTGGFGVAWPIAPRPEGVPKNYMLAPFIGYLLAQPDNPWFIQGFQQFDLPFDKQDQFVMQTDVGIGYWVRRGKAEKLITDWAPTFEIHAYTPFGPDPHGDLLGLQYSNAVNATFGATFFFGPATSLGLGVGLPIAGGRDYDVEGHLHFNWRF